MTAYRARELAEKNEHLSLQFLSVFKVTNDPVYKQKSNYHRELSAALNIAAEALKAKEDYYGRK